MPTLRPMPGDDGLCALPTIPSQRDDYLREVEWRDGPSFISQWRTPHPGTFANPFARKPANRSRVAALMTRRNK